MSLARPPDRSRLVYDNSDQNTECQRYKMIELVQNSLPKAYTGRNTCNSQEARPFLESKWSGGGTPNRASWSTRSMQQSELTDYQSVVEEPWKEPDVLRELYHGEGLTLAKVGERLDVSEATIHRWMDHHGIDRRNGGVEDGNAPYRDREVLERLYVQQGLSLREIAGRFGCYNTTVHYWLKRHGIETRNQKTAYGSKTGTYQIGSEGYMRFSDGRKQIRMHQLVAIANGDPPEVVFGGNANVHHKNGIKWDNRPENIETLSRSGHMKHHAEEKMDTAIPPDTIRSEEWLREQYHAKENSMKEMADKAGVARVTIQYWMDKHGINRRDAATARRILDSRGDSG